MKTHVWITGASSGIGKAVALEMAARGYDLIISGRNREALKQVADQTGAYILAFDATDRQANLDAAKDLNQRYECIDIVFLNAGWEILRCRFQKDPSLVRSPCPKICLSSL